MKKEIKKPAKVTEYVGATKRVISISDKETEKPATVKKK